MAVISIIKEIPELISNIEESESKKLTKNENNDIINIKQFKCKTYPYQTGKTVYASEFKKDIDYFLNGYIMTVWRKIYRRDFLFENNIFFDDELLCFEDRAFTTLCFEKAKSICGTNEVLYHYVIREDSNVNTYFLKLLDIFCNMNKEILENYEKMSHEEFEDYIQKYFYGMKKPPYRKMTRKEKIKLVRIVRESDFVNKLFTQPAGGCVNISGKYLFSLYFLKYVISYILFRYKFYNILSYIIK